MGAKRSDAFGQESPRHHRVRSSHRRWQWESWLPANTASRSGSSGEDTATASAGICGAPLRELENYRSSAGLQIKGTENRRPLMRR